MTHAEMHPRKPEAQSTLQSKPQPRSGRRLSTLLVWFVGVLLIGAGLVGAWQLIPHAGGAGAAPVGKPATQATIPGEGDPQIYWDTIKAQVAQGLHLSVAELRSRLQAYTNDSTKSGSGDTTPPIITVATQQGVAPDQLRGIELAAIQQACDKLVSLGALTREQADQRISSFQQQEVNDLSGYIMYAFQNK